MANETERALRREIDPKCANPFCATLVRVRGECCRECLDQQQRHVEAMRAFRAQRQA